jgi:hypothetical protein
MSCEVWLRGENRWWFCRRLYYRESTLRRLRCGGLDWENLAEELRAMDRSEKSALESHLENLLTTRLIRLPRTSVR